VALTFHCSLSMQEKSNCYSANLRKQEPFQPGSRDYISLCEGHHLSPTKVITFNVCKLLAIACKLANKDSVLFTIVHLNKGYFSITGKQYPIHNTSYILIKCKIKTFGVCPLTFPARANEPCTLPNKHIVTNNKLSYPSPKI